LALAIDPRSADARRRWHAYERATADLRVSKAVRTEIEALSAGARREVTAMLLERVRQSPMAQRRQLLREWKQRRRHPVLVAARTPVDDWRDIVVRHAFAPPSKTPPPRGTLTTEAESVRAATRLLARTLADDASAAQWHDDAISSLEAIGLSTPRAPGRGLAPASPTVGDPALGVALRVRRLSLMQRPLLLKAWNDSAQRVGLLERPGAVDALALAFRALDVAAASRPGSSNAVIP
jgi:hypothetical protein